jgi:ribose transport system substrate-binding protein
MNRLIASALLFCAAVCMLSACEDRSTTSSSSGSSSTTQPSGGGGGGSGKKIAVIPKGTTHVFWKTVEAGARKAAEEAGAEMIWKGPLKEDDRAEQIKVVEQFVSEGVDGICLAPLDTDALAAKAKEQLSSFKVPKKFFVLPDAEVPWLPSQKVDKRTLIALAEKLAR